MVCCVTLEDQADDGGGGKVVRLHSPQLCDSISFIYNNFCWYQLFDHTITSHRLLLSEECQIHLDVAGAIGDNVEESFKVNEEGSKGNVEDPKDNVEDLKDSKENFEDKEVSFEDSVESFEEAIEVHSEDGAALGEVLFQFKFTCKLYRTLITPI